MRIGIAAMGSVLGNGGGLDIYTRYLVEALADNDSGNSYVILVSQASQETWSYRPWPSNVRFVPLYDIEPRRSALVRAQRLLWRTLGLPVPAHYGDPYLARQIDSLGLDLVHFPRTTIWPLSVQTACVLTFFDLQHEYYPQFFTQAVLDHRARTYKPSVDKARWVIAPSTYTRQTIIEKYGTRAGKISVVPVGLADTFSRADEAEVARVQRRYNLPDRFIYYPANPWQHKNHARLIAALRIYRERYSEAPTLVVSGRLRNETRDATEFATAAGIDKQVIDVGYLPRADRTAVYTAATMMVFPSLFEGFGIPLVEAMACGCPIAAADTTSIPEVVGDAALLFDPFDPCAIAETIHRLLIDEALRRALVAKGYQQIGRFDWKSIATELVQIYQQVALYANDSKVNG